MLINTVIMFLKDLLPIFILICLLSTYVQRQDLLVKAKIYLVLASFVGVFVSFYYLPNMGELFGGIGIEAIKSIALIIVYGCLLISSTRLLTQSIAPLYQQYLVAIAVVIFIIINASEFIVFVDSYIDSSQSVRDVLAGLSIGFGICLSFSALLYFLLLWFIQKSLFSVLYLFTAFFLSGQLCQIISLLQQVDMINTSTVLWDSANLVRDSSEYGHLLNSLFGYEASPSLEFMMLYLASLLLFLVGFYIVSPARTKNTAGLKES